MGWEPEGSRADWEKESGKQEPAAVKKKWWRTEVNRRLWGEQPRLKPLEANTWERIRVEGYRRRLRGTETLVWSSVDLEVHHRPQHAPLLCPSLPKWEGNEAELLWAANHSALKSVAVFALRCNEETVKIKLLQEHFWCERGRRSKEMGGSARVSCSTAKAAHMGSGEIFLYCCFPDTAGRECANLCPKIGLLGGPLRRSV